MSRNDKIMMPSSQGGLVRYFDEENSKWRVKPGHVVALITIIAILEIVLYYM